MLHHRHSRLAVVFVLALFGCRRSDSATPARATSEPTFGAWAEAFAAEWVRQSPQMTTRTQYLSGEESDRAARQLSLIGEWDYARDAEAVVAESRARDLARPTENGGWVVRPDVAGRAGELIAIGSTASPRRMSAARARG